MGHVQDSQHKGKLHDLNTISLFTEICQCSDISINTQKPLITLQGSHSNIHEPIVCMLFLSDVIIKMFCVLCSSVRPQQPTVHVSSSSGHRCAPAGDGLLPEADHQGSGVHGSVSPSLPQSSLSPPVLPQSSPCLPILPQSSPSPPPVLPHSPQSPQSPPVYTYMVVDDSLLLQFTSVELFMDQQSLHSSN